MPHSLPGLSAEAFGANWQSREDKERPSHAHQLEAESQGRSPSEPPPTSPRTRARRTSASPQDSGVLTLDREGNGRASEEIAATLFPLESEQESTRCTKPVNKITPSAGFGITEGLWKQEVLSNLESS